MWKKFLFAVGIAFAVTLAIVVGTQMTSDAMAVIIGVFFGLLASVPTSIILVWVLRQRDKQLETQMQGRGMPGHYPPVVVVNGQPNGYGGYTPPAPALTSATNGQRNFKVIGQEETESKGNSVPPIWEDF